MNIDSLTFGELKQIAAMFQTAQAVTVERRLSIEACNVVCTNPQTRTRSAKQNSRLR